MSSNMNFETSINFVDYFPYEINNLIFKEMRPKTLLTCKGVSKSWKQIAENDYIWKSKFKDEKSWEYHNEDSETDSWYELYKERYLLEYNWKNDIFTQHKLRDDFEIFCVKCFKNWIITGSEDCTIQIWDSETLKCLRVLGESIPEDMRKDLPMEDLELAIDSDNIFHSDTISCVDINDKYLVSGSWDGTCIIWRLSDFKPIDLLFISGGREFLKTITDVTLYNDYIVCSDDFGYIGVWKSNLDNSEHQIQFNLLHCLKGDEFKSINNVCIQDDIIYAEAHNIITSWNIESGQMIKEFRNHFVACMAVKDQCFFVGEYDTIKILDLQSNKVISTFSDKLVFELCVNDNRIISIDCDDTIRIRSLNDQKLLNEYKKLDTSPISSVYFDSKRMVILTIGADIIIYDFTKNLRKKYLKHI